MITLGVLLLLLGWLTGLGILWSLGVILLLIGAVFAVAGALGRPIGSRSHYF